MERLLNKKEVAQAFGVSVKAVDNGFAPDRFLL